MLAVKKTKGPGKEIKCQAYAKGTDFNQPPGAIFHAGFYHALNSKCQLITRLQVIIIDTRSDASLLVVIDAVLGLLAMLVHHGLRGLVPAVLPTLFKFVPALQGQSGLGGSGTVMIYIGLQTTSYS